MAIPSAEHALRDAGWEVSSASTRSGEDGTYLAKKAAEKGIDAVFAVGGDGTIGQVASGLIGTKTALGILPAGTANVWGKELGMQPYSFLANNALEENAKKLANASIYAVDVGVCNQQPFLMWAGLGLDALSVQKVEPRFRLEKFFTMPEYATSILLTAARWRGISLKIWADGEEIEGHYILAVINNIRHYMGGMTNLSPDAMLDDGIFDLWLFSGNNMADALRPVVEMWGGRHIDSSHTRRIPFKELRLEADTDFAIQTDGEPRFDTKNATITVKKRALRVLMPENGLSALSQEPLS
jgi:YegS/Rv2252/BmrU family lipid kinase